jgi:hypothetical protein
VDLFSFIAEMFLSMVGGVWSLKKEKWPKFGKLSPRSCMDDIYRCSEHGEWICKQH